MMSKTFLSITLWLCTFCVPTTPSVFEEPCDELTIETADNTMTISNLKAAHTNMEVYKVGGDGGWTQIFTCNDNCGEQATVKVEAQKKYIIHVKMFDANWAKICDKQIEHIATGESTEREEAPSCDNVTVGVQDGTMTIGNVKAPHSHTDIYKVRADGGWDTIFTCNDNCKESITVEADAKQKYVVHVKYFSEAWSMVCEKQIEYNPQ
jgi:5-formaminoimidazole-4-carboxamide-1-beta-D-ribofuranosyl 5'-monophosphate synthetase